MTKLGKLLVYLNLLFGVGLAALALGIATNRIEWVGAKPSESKGEIEKVDADIKAQQDLFERSTQRWQFERRTLASLEQKRRADQQWYAQQLKAMEDGKGPNLPVDVLVFENGQLKLDKNGLPVLEPARDRRWLAIKALDQQIEIVDKEIVKEQGDIFALIKQEEALTRILNGNMGRPRGLRDLLDETATAQKQASLELLFVKRMRINGLEEASSLVNRQRQLKARLEVLKKTGVAADLP